MSLKSRLKQIIVIVYVTQLVISTALIFWGWKANLDPLLLMTWILIEITGVLIMFEWFKRLDTDYIKKLYQANIERDIREELERENASKLKKIDNQIDYVYQPMKDVIENFQKERGFTAYSSEVINNTIDLEIALKKIIDANTDIEIDKKVMYIKVRFFSKTSNTNDNLNTFLRAIQLKINKLKDEKRKYV